MSENDIVDELLDRHDDAVAAGRPLSLEELCRDHPGLIGRMRRELAAEAAVHAKLDRFLKPSCAAGDLPFTAGRYRALRPHGGGGMGEVFVAVDSELDREVALKRARAGDAETRLRLDREARITARLDHPGVVAIFGTAADPQGRPCYAMRLVPGRNLDDAIAEFHRAHPGRSAAAESALSALLRRFLVVCQTVAYAHNRGVVHRDIKPSNVLVGDFGETVVADWGLAKSVGRSDGAGSSDAVGLPRPETWPAAPEVSRVGDVRGSPGYMSPEQAAGQALGPASDVFSLGATLYKLLTGRAPFDGHSRQEPPRPRAIRSDVPPGLEAVCLKAMQTPSAGRYDDAKALADDIERWLADAPVSAGGEPWSIRVARWGRRRRTVVFASLAAVAVAAVGAALLAWTTAEANRRLEDRNAELAAARDAETAARIAEQRAAEEARMQRDRACGSRYRTAMLAAAAALAEGHNARARELFESETPRPGEPDPRGWEWHHLRGVFGGEIWNSRLPSTVEAAAFAAGGRRLAAVAGRQLAYFDAADGRRLWAVDADSKYLFALAVSPDGRRIATGGVDGIVRVFELSDRPPETPVGVLHGHTMPVRGLAYSPDGKRLLSGGTDGLIRLWDPATGNGEHLVAPSEDAVHSVAFSPDGRHVAAASGSQNGRVRIWDTAGNAPPEPRHRPPQFDREIDARVNRLIFSSDGKALALALESATTITLNGGAGWDKATVLGGHPSSSRLPVRCVAVAPDGSSWAFGELGGNVGLVYGAGAHVWLRRTESVTALAWSPDARRIAVGDFGGGLAVFDVAERKAAAMPFGPLGPVPGSGRPQLTGGWTDGRALALLTADRTVVWTADAADLNAEPGWARTNDWGLAARATPSPDRTRLAVCADVVRVMDLRNGAEVSGPWTKHRGLGAAWVGHEPLLAAGDSSGALRVWNVDSGRELRRWTLGSSVAAIAAPRNGGVLFASTEDGRLHRLAINPAGAELSVDTGPDPVWALAVSPDGRRIACGTREGWVTGRRTDDSSLIWKAPPHKSWVSTFAFSTDGAILVSGSQDGSVRLWDAADGTARFSLDAESAVLWVAITSRGDIAAVTRDGALRRWNRAP